MVSLLGWFLGIVISRKIDFYIDFFMAYYRGFFSVNDIGEKGFDRTFHVICLILLARLI